MTLACSTSGFITILSVSVIINVTCLVVPGAHGLLILGSMDAIIIAQLGPVQSRLQNMVTWNQYSYWKILTPELLEWGDIFLTCLSNRISGASAPY
jgi:hypothetical protein